jgi:hypothetical protein
MTFEHGKEEVAFILDTTREKLRAAPGFDKANWPDFADPNWTDKIDDHYRQADQRAPAQTLLAK